MKAYLNNTELKADAARLQDIDITYRKRRKADYANQIEFYGWAYDLIKAELIDDDFGYLKTLPFRVERTCCGGGVVFEGLVRGDKLDWDSDGCTVSASIIQNDEATEAYRKFESKTFIDDLPETGHPYLWAPGGQGLFTTYLTVVFRIGFTTLLQTIRAVLVVIESVFGDRSDLYEDFERAVNQMDEQIALGLGQWLNMPYLRDIINANAESEGLTVQSSIFNDPASAYYNLAYVSVLSEPYSILSRVKGVVSYKNFPVQSFTAFLDGLASIFNTDWFVKDGVLYIERRDNLPESAAFDISNESDLFIEFEWLKDPKKAYFDMEWTPDATERAGSENLDLFNHIEEWNAAGNESQEGALKTTPVYAPYFLDLPYGSKAKALVIKTFISLFGVSFSIKEPTLNLTDKYIYVPKLLPIIKTGDVWKADPGNQMYGQTLYDSFWDIENPNTSGFRGLGFSASFTADCAFLDVAKDLTLVNLPVGNNTALGYVKSIEVNYTSNTVTIQGEI